MAGGARGRLVCRAGRNAFYTLVLQSGISRFRTRTHRTYSALHRTHARSILRSSRHSCILRAAHTRQVIAFLFFFVAIVSACA